MDVQTYLMFPGTCEDAIETYQEVLAASVLFLARYDRAPKDLCPVGAEEKIFHATLRVGETLLNLSDDLSGEYGAMSGFVLLLHLDSDLEAEWVFSALSQNGKVRLPLDATFWASKYGIVTDRFGVTWKVQSS